MERIKLTINKLALPMKVSIYKGEFLVKETEVDEHKAILNTALDNLSTNPFELVSIKRFVNKAEEMFQATHIHIEEKK